MTYEERKQQICKKCKIRLACAYISRGLEDKCTYLQDIMQGWEYFDNACEWIYQQQLTLPNIGQFINKFRKAMEV